MHLQSHANNLQMSKKWYVQRNARTTISKARHSSSEYITKIISYRQRHTKEMYITFTHDPTL